MLLRRALLLTRSSALAGHPGGAQCGASAAAARPIFSARRFLASDAGPRSAKPTGGTASDGGSSTKWFWGFVLVPCILLPALFIEGDVQDVKSGRIQRKNTTWY